MRIVKISDLTEEEKEKWQQQVQARQQKRAEEQRVINEKRSGSAFNNIPIAQPLPTQNFDKLVQVKKQEQEKAKKTSKVISNNNNIQVPQTVQGPTTKQNFAKDNLILPSVPTQNFSNMDLSQATELTNNKYKAIQEARKINEDMKRRRL